MGRPGGPRWGRVPRPRVRRYLAALIRIRAVTVLPSVVTAVTVNVCREPVLIRRRSLSVPLGSVICTVRADPPFGALKATRPRNHFTLAPLSFRPPMTRRPDILTRRDEAGFSVLGSLTRRLLRALVATRVRRSLGRFLPTP